jgi:hypothetical protein
VGRPLCCTARRCIAVGMPVTRHSLHRSGREALPHPAPTWGLTANGSWGTAGAPANGLPYMRQRLGHARPALRPVRVTCRLFPLVTALPSPRSAARRGALFAGFCGVESEEVGQCPSLCPLAQTARAVFPPAAFLGCAFLASALHQPRHARSPAYAAKRRAQSACRRPAPPGMAPSLGPTRLEALDKPPVKPRAEPAHSRLALDGPPTPHARLAPVDPRL